MRRVERRLGRLEAGARVAARDPSPPIMIVFPEDWPTAELAAYEAAGRDGDFAAWAEAVARATGTRPGPRTRVVAIRERPDGPQ